MSTTRWRRSTSWCASRPRSFRGCEEISPYGEEAACHELLTRYHDQIDGTERLAAVNEAKGEKKLAVQYYRKAAPFAQGSPGFDQELIDWYSSKAKELEADD